MFLLVSWGNEVILLPRPDVVAGVRSQVMAIRPPARGPVHPLTRAVINILARHPAPVVPNSIGAWVNAPRMPVRQPVPYFPPRPVGQPPLRPGTLPTIPPTEVYPGPRPYQPQPYLPQVPPTESFPGPRPYLPQPVPSAGILQALLGAGRYY
jgi:hypothetical protein